MIPARFCVTGTRYEHGRLHFDRVADAILSLRRRFLVTEWTTGAQFGADTAAFYAGLELLPDAQHRVVYPHGVPHNEGLVDEAIDIMECGHWNDEPRRVEVVAVEGIYRSPKIGGGKDGPSAYMKRNEVMLDASDRVAVFPSTPTEQIRSGTWATVRRARLRSMPLHFWPLGTPRDDDANSWDPWEEPPWRESRRAVPAA